MRRRFVAPVLAAFALSLSLSAYAAEPVQSFTLPNGQALYVQENHDQPIVTIDTWVKTGSVNERQDINGVSHFLEHLLFKGTKTHVAGDFERRLEARGAEFNAATSADFTHYHVTIASPYFEEALGLHSDMMLNAEIPADELDRERKVVQEEINRALDNPQHEAYMTMAKLLYDKHGYAMDTLGPKELIGSVPREKIMDYYHYWYQPKNFSTVIAGDVDAETAKKLVTKYFPAPTYATPKTYVAPTVGTPIAGAQPKIKIFTHANIEQSYLTMALLGPSIHQDEDSVALDIAMLALGGGKSSRLYQRLKEKEALVTGISAGNMTQQYSGLLYVDAQMKPENSVRVKKEILEELVKITETGVTADELEKAKTQYTKDFVFLNETTDGVASTIGYNVTIGKLDDYTDYVAKIQKVTQDDVVRALRKYMDFNKATLVEMIPEKSLKKTGRT